MSLETLRPDHWHLSLTRFDSARAFCPVTELEDHRIDHVDDLDQALARFQDEAKLAIGLDEFDEDDCHWGSFWLFLNGARAWIHLLEGPCLTARDPTLDDNSHANVEFIIDNGDTKDIPFSDTVAREQGLRALRAWMTDGEKISELAWDRA